MKQRRAIFSNFHPRPNSKMRTSRSGGTYHVIDAIEPMFIAILPKLNESPNSALFYFQLDLAAIKYDQIRHLDSFSLIFLLALAHLISLALQ